MRVETPDHFMGKPIPEDAIERALWKQLITQTT